ncbi:MAG TPA: hypothetical protein VIM11_15480, partial [Tepidisphaeraceae bacterium]
MAIITCPKCGTKNRVDENRAAATQPVCGKCGEELSLSTPGASENGHPITVTDANFDSVVADARPVLV